tara:strand:- start:4258 stop:4548 length:291 start_codon:yes stop_codon:yes gene_type:complete
MRKKREAGSIPFGYDLDSEDSDYIISNQEHLNTFQDVVDSVVLDSINLREGSEWLQHKTGRYLSSRGLQKHIDKNYGKRNSSERLENQFRLLSERQ